MAWLALIPLSVDKSCWVFCPHRCMAAELSRVPMENAGWTCALVLVSSCLPSACRGEEWWVLSQWRRSVVGTARSLFLSS